MTHTKVHYLMLDGASPEEATKMIREMAHQRTGPSKPYKAAVPRTKPKRAVSILGERAAEPAVA